MRLLQQRKRIGDCVEMSLVRHGQAGARLGLVVSSKFLPRAVDRNAFKRIVRETFREHRAVVPPGDLLIRLRQSLRGEPRAQWKARVAGAVRNLLLSSTK